MLNRTPFRSVLVVWFTLAITVLSVRTCPARSPAAKLLPQDTAIFLRIAEGKDLQEKFLKTSLGRIGNDPQIAPLVSQLYGSGLEALAKVEQALGVSIPEALAILQGEVAVGVIPRDGQGPAFVLLVDVGTQLPTAHKLLEKGLEAAQQNGANVNDETINGVKFTTVSGRRNGPPMTYFEKDTVIVIGNDVDTLKGVLEKWDGTKAPTLAQNVQYAAVMHRCEVGRDNPPQIALYADPISLAKSAGRGNFSTQFILALLPTLGLDGFKGLGASITLVPGEFDSVIHAHLLLDNPRAGVIEVLALGQGDTTPERWVPGDVQTYSTWYWDFNQSYNKINTLVDSFQGDGAFKNLVKSNVSEKLGVDLETELLPALDGRVTHAAWIEKPATSVMANGNLIAFKLKKPDEFVTTLEKFLATRPEIEKKSYAGVTYYTGAPPQRDLIPQDQLPTPCFAIMEGYLMGFDRVKFLEKIVRDKDDTANNLGKSLDFKLINSKIVRHAGDAKPGMISFNRPEEGVRMWYDLATNEKTRDRLKSMGENNKFFQVLEEALQKNPLPPFAAIAKYLAPGGALLTNDETGFHYTAFTLRRD